MEFREAVARLDAIVREVERDGDARALRLLQLIDAVHRPALERLVDGEDDHPAVRALLAMYDLAEVDELTWADEALDAIRPELAESGGGVELVSVEGSVAVLRPGGALRADAPGAAGLRRVAEATLCGLAPFVESVRWDEPAAGVALPLAASPRPAVVPLPMAPDGAAPSASNGNGPGRPAASPLTVHRMNAPDLVEVGRVADFPAGGLRAVGAGELEVVVANVEGELFALRAGCAVDGRPLEGGRLTGVVLVCPWHNCAYDVRTGKRVDDAGEPAVPVVPVAVRDGVVKLAVGVRSEQP